MSDTPISTASVNLAITTTRPAGKVNDKVARIIVHSDGRELAPILVGTKAMGDSFRETHNITGVSKRKDATQGTGVYATVGLLFLWGC